MNKELSNNIAVKIFTICLHDIVNSQGNDEYYDFLKCSIREYGEEFPKNLLRKCIKQGVLFHFGRISFEKHFGFETFERCFLYEKNDNYFDIESVVIYLSELSELVNHHKFNENCGYIKLLNRQTNHAWLLYEEDNENNIIIDIHDNWDKSKFIQFVSRRIKMYSDLFYKISDKHSDKFEQVSHLYANYIHNQLFNSRVFCEIISNLICDIGFKNVKDKTTGKFLFKRRRLASFDKKILKKMLLERERNKCAICDEKITLKTMSIDHILPLSQGGCNDLCNLQATCETCNNRKNNSILPTNDSIPDHARLLYKKNH